MADPISFYHHQIKAHTAQLLKVKKQLLAYSMLRLVVFLLTVFAVYLFFGEVKWVIAIVLVAIAAFIYLVSRQTDLQYRRDTIVALLKINQTEIEVKQRRYFQLPKGNEYKDAAHYFSQDIDLFGRGSFYQYLNRTALQEGSDLLAALLTENAIDQIGAKQKAIEELSEMAEWRQEFSATASLVKTGVRTEEITAWLERNRPFVSQLMGRIPKLFSVLSVSVLALLFFNLLPGSVLLFWSMLGLAISLVFTKKITKLSIHISKIKSTFYQYNKLLILLEDAVFKSPLLQEKQKLVANEHIKPSQAIKELSTLLNALDNNNNIFYLIFANGLFLQSITTSYKIEKWIEKNGKDVKKWFNSIAFFDAYNSLGNFAFNHPGYTYPSLSDKDFVLQSVQAGHPLLDPGKSVLNDIQIGKERFFIITGANMAGKSTFLRTVSLQIVMANVGLPVCAEKVVYNPVKLMTSMRTTDSLTDNESYFFSELKRLQFMVEELKKDTYFIVLDEILKGTNSTDKAIGSRKFVEKLVASKATGIIATHDLSLCGAAKEIPQIENFYFDAQIIANELYFDYAFKKGICQNMNASFLLKKMGITD